MTKKPDLENIRKWFWRLKNAILIWLGQLGCLKTKKKNANLISDNFTICKTSIGRNSVKSEAFREIFFQAFLELIGAATHTKQSPKSPKKAPL